MKTRNNIQRRRGFPAASRICLPVQRGWKAASTFFVFLTRRGHRVYLIQLVLTFLLCLALTGCWGGEEKAAANNGNIARATPTSPTGAPRTPTPTSPMPAPAIEEMTPKGKMPEKRPERKSVSLAELAGKGDPLSLGNMSEVHTGLTIEQVNRLLGKPGEMFSSSSVDSEIYRWTDDSGASFVGKFENGVLMRKSTFLPEAAQGTNADEASGEGLLTKSLYDQVRPGMTAEEIQKMLDVDRRVVSDYDTEVTMFEWVDSKGSNFYARFENGRMTRKTGFHVAPLKPDRDETAQPGDTEETEAPTEDVSSEASPLEADTDEEPAIAESAEDVYEPETSPARDSGPTVAVVGGTRDPEESSYAPKARFPEYTWQFRRGDYEVRINNIADVEVKVGLRSGDYGKDVAIRPGGRASIDVEQGTYTLYFQYDDDPQNVYTGQSFTIDAMRLADVEIQVFNEAYDIGVLDRGFER